MIAIATIPPHELPKWYEIVLTSPFAWAIGLVMVGLWLILPRGNARGRWFGALCGIVAIGLLAWHVPRLCGWLDESVFDGLAITVVVACGATISVRNPLYSAIWFGLALVGTAGLFLLIGAQFLSVATITVYAGAILVTVLFVIMLAQPEGHAYYDRLSWEALLSAVTGTILVGMMTSVIGHATSGAPLPGERTPGMALEIIHPRGSDRLASVSVAAAGIAEEDREAGILAEEHVAGFGRELLGRYLIAMQVAGALMLAALVGAMAIVVHGRRTDGRQAIRIGNM
ncbi:MAG: NADH-quinone oxidoreductase subunit J [Pirellulales bacterium]|nr:NADH-quinone oxidoreductase subunit J [Pirellulales bacterium]